jgi:O-antigen/teichoic acid export membrane protein
MSNTELNPVRAGLPRQETLTNEQTQEIKTASLRATIWSIARAGWSNLSSFVIFAILARLLGPKQFGLYALAAAGLEVVRVLSNAGLSEAIQREQNLERDAANSAFTAGLILSLVLVALTMVCAVPYGHLMHDPRIPLILGVLSLTLPITALGNIHIALILREFGHKYIAVRSIIGGTIAGALAIIAAYRGAGVWALVIQTLVMEIVGTCVAWIASPWRLRPAWNRSCLSRLLRFGSGITVTQLLWAILARAPDFFIGRTLGFGAVGTYRVAWRAFDLIGQAVMQPIANVSVITLSRVQNDDGRFRRAYLKITGISGLLSLPLIAGFGLVASDLVPLVFGEQWRESGTIARIVSVAAIPYTLNYFFPAALSARGNSRALVSIAGLQVFSTVVIAAFLTSHGLRILAVGVVVRGYITLPFIQYQLARATRMSFWKSVSSLLPGITGSAIMIACLYPLSRVLQATVPFPAVRIGALALVGSVIYGTSLWLLFYKSHSSYIRDLTSLLRPQERTS